MAMTVMVAVPMAMTTVLVISACNVSSLESTKGKYVASNEVTCDLSQWVAGKIGGQADRRNGHAAESQSLSRASKEYRRFRTSILYSLHALPHFLSVTHSAVRRDRRELPLTLHLRWPSIVSVRFARIRGIIRVFRSSVCREKFTCARTLFVDPLRVSTITGGGSEARMLLRPRITPVRVNLPPNQDVVRVASSYISCRAYRREIFLEKINILFRESNLSWKWREIAWQSPSERIFAFTRRVNNVNRV